MTIPKSWNELKAISILIWWEDEKKTYSFDLCLSLHALKWSILSNGTAGHTWVRSLVQDFSWGAEFDFNETMQKLKSSGSLCKTSCNEDQEWWAGRIWLLNLPACTYKVHLTTANTIFSFHVEYFFSPLFLRKKEGWRKVKDHKKTPAAYRWKNNCNMLGKKSS